MSQIAKAQAAARALTAQGIVVVQSRATEKRPIGKWKDAALLTPDQLDQWTAPNLQIVTGSKSGNLFVIDCDGVTGYAALGDAMPGIMDTWTVTSGSGKGKHVYFRADILPDSIEIFDIAALNGDNLEIKANRRLVVAPPSIHPDTGKPYTVSIAAPVKHLTLDELQQLINWIRSFQPEKKRRQADRQLIDFAGNRRELHRAIVQHMPPDAKPGTDGWINHSCILPGHDDRQPSAGFHPQSGMYKCFRCGKRTAEEIAPYYGVNPDDHRTTAPERRAALGTAERLPNTPRPQTAPPVQPEPAPDAWLTDGLRKAVIQLRSKKGFEGLPDNALPFLEIINFVPDTFTVTDCFTASFRSKTGMNEDSVRKLLAVLIDQDTGQGLFFDDLKTLVNEPVSTSRQKRGRSTKTYRRLSPQEAENRLIRFAEKAYRESLAIRTPTRITPQMLQDIGLTPEEASQLPDELNALAASDAMIEHLVIQAIATLKMHFRDTHLTALPDDLPRHNGKTWVIAWTRAQMNEHHRQPMTRAAIVQEIGISNASIERVFDLADIKRTRQIGKHAPEYLRRDEDISRQIQRARGRVKGKPVKLLARKGETERVLYLRENTDPAPFAKQALSEGYEVMVHFETAAIIEVNEYTERKKKAPEKRRILIAPRHEAKPPEVMHPISFKHSREWVRHQFLLRLIISQGGEVPPPEVRNMPVDELLEYIVGRPLQWVEPVDCAEMLQNSAIQNRQETA